MRAVKYPSMGPLGNLLLEKLEYAADEKDLITSLINRVDALIVILDTEGRITQINRACERVIGYVSRDVSGIPFWDIAQNEEEAVRIKMVIDELRHGRTTNKHVNTWISKDGNPHQIAWTNATLIERGHMKYMISTGIDITDRTRSKKEELEQRTLAEALADTAAIINKTLDLEEVLDRVLENLKRVSDHDLACILLIQDGVAQVVRHQSYIKPEIDLSLCFLEIKFKIDVFSNLMEIVTHRRPVIVSDYEEDGRQTVYTWLRSSVGVPIIFDDKIIGIITLDSQKYDHFSQKTAEQLQAFADQAAIAIQNARLYRELEAYSGFLEQAVDERTAELRRVKERVEAILNNTPDPVILLGPDGKIDISNPAFETMFGYDHDEVTSQSLSLIVAPEQADLFSNTLAIVLDSRETRRLELLAVKKGGRTFDTEIALAPVIEGGQLIGIVCTLRDISAMKEVARMKDTFVSNVSHELRTPITSLRLNHHLVKLNPQNEKVYLERLAREIDRLDDLIEDLLRLSHLDQGRVALELQNLDLNALIAQFIQDRAPLAESLHLRLIFSQQPHLPVFSADEGLLSQSLSVLLTNAINYTPAGGQITVSTHTREAEGCQWVGFSVSDTGPGISPEEQKRIFERFYRGKVGRESGVPGTGLGLVIADEIIRRHGGTMEVSSEGVSGKGATFAVWFPIIEGPNSKA